MLSTPRFSIISCGKTARPTSQCLRPNTTCSHRPIQSSGRQKIATDSASHCQKVLCRSVGPRELTMNGDGSCCGYGCHLPGPLTACLEQLDRPETKLEWTLALVHAATALRPEECFALQWRDLDHTNNQILVQRAWSKGRETDGKSKGSMKPVAMHPALAEFLNEWRKESCYNRDDDWMFASSREKGRVPRAASTCGKHYLRPAAVSAGVIAKDDHSRFGWHNLRHSLATFFGSNEVHPSVIQTMLRHTKPQTTARYIHAVNVKQIEAQGRYLDAIKIVANQPDRVA